MVASRLTAAQRAKVFKALSDPHRVAIVDALARNGPQCGTQLAEELGISIALVSHHWEVLVEAGLIRKERVGQQRYCSLDLEKLREATARWEDIVDALADVPKKTTEPKKPKSTRKKSA